MHASGCGATSTHWMNAFALHFCWPAVQAGFGAEAASKVHGSTSGAEQMAVQPVCVQQWLEGPTMSELAHEISLPQLSLVQLWLVPHEMSLPQSSQWSQDAAVAVNPDAKAMMRTADKSRSMEGR